VFYRVLQDALRNVEQHAQARHVTVNLMRRSTIAQLVVKDDGIGFDTNDQRAKELQEGRLGLLSMRERAIGVGGSLSVKSTPSAGTEVRLCVPLSSKCPPAARGAEDPPPPPTFGRDDSGREGIGYPWGLSDAGPLVLRKVWAS
jgi:signal transduction histidine kinase